MHNREEILALVDVFVMASSYRPQAVEKLRELGHPISSMADMYRLHSETYRQLERLCPEIVAADYRLNMRQLAVLANTRGPVDMKALDREREANIRRALRGVA
jgi:hypothetical protein